jgi:hypothetical protein
LSWPQADDVARHELLGRKLHDLAVALHAGRHDQHLPKRGHAFGSFAFLVKTHHRVQHGESEYDEGRRHILNRDDAYHGCANKHQLHQVLVLAEERLPRRLLGFLGQLVGTVFGPSLRDLLRGQAYVGMHVEFSTDLVDRQRVVRKVVDRRRFDGCHELPPRVDWAL